MFLPARGTAGRGVFLLCSAAEHSNKRDRGRGENRRTELTGPEATVLLLSACLSHCASSSSFASSTRPASL